VEEKLPEMEKVIEEEKTPDPTLIIAEAISKNEAKKEE
jgi:hypothetical protein